MKFAVKSLAASIVFMAATLSHAGEFGVQFFSSTLVKPSADLADIVSDKFTTRFPTKSWMIVVIGSSYSWTTGGGAGHATVGVVPRTKKTEVPLVRFSAYVEQERGPNLNPSDLEKLETKAMRSAVQHLMKACDVEPNCNVYNK